MKFLFLDYQSNDWGSRAEILRKEFPDVEFFVEGSSESEHLKDCDGIITYRLTEEQIDQAENLKIVFIPYTGLNLFPRKKLLEKGIIVSNSHGNGVQVAEHALALTLTIMGRVIEYHSEMKKGYWHRSFDYPDFWTSLHDRKVAILGVGGVGKEIALLLQPFNCDVTGFRRKEMPDPPAGFNRITNNLAEAIAGCDVLFVTLPLTPHTHDLVTKAHLVSMKGGFLINVARGKVIQEEALYTSLTDGTLRGAGIDTWYVYPGGKEEPVFPGNLPFHELDNIVMSPHNATHVEEAVLQDMDMTVDNVRSFIKTGKPVNQMDLEQGY